MIASKKNLNILILKILEEYTDEDHPIQQQEVVRILKQRYDIEVDRRSVKNNIDALMELDYDIATDSRGYRLLSRTLDDTDLRVLIDSVLFSKSVSKKQSKSIIEKLIGMSNKYFVPKVSHVTSLPNLAHTENKTVLYTVEAVNEAITKGRKISFTYYKYGTDFKLHPKNDITYVVTPFQMVACNGFYYMIANYDKYDDISHYRIDKMGEVKILEDKAKKKKDVKGIENGFNLPEHMAEHIYMYSGENVHAVIKADRYIFDELVDWFGKDFRIISENEDEIVIRVKCNEQALFYWAMQYGTCAEIIESEALREQVRTAAIEMVEKYE